MTNARRDAFIEWLHYIALALAVIVGIMLGGVVWTVVAAVTAINVAFRLLTSKAIWPIIAIAAMVLGAAYLKVI